MGQLDGAGRFVIFVLLCMSVGTWCLILAKTWELNALKGRIREFMAHFANSNTVPDLEKMVQEHPAREPFGRIVERGLQACAQMKASTDARLFNSSSPEEVVALAVKRSIADDASRLENGLNFLATVGASAPFVGLFGTVWSIYQALVRIGATGQGSIDKVAGPVGEALIMTAVGLAVALPAVFAYNIIARSHQLLLAELDGFAEDIYGMLSTGVRRIHGTGKFISLLRGK